MRIYFYSALCGFMLSGSLMAQSTDIENLLTEIEKNNRELNSMASLYESKKLDLKSGNNLPDPQVAAYYLPWGDHPTGDYTEFQISQSFDFPTVYTSRNKLIKKQSAQLDLEYGSARQDLLARARKHCLKLIYLNKRQSAESIRFEQAEKAYDHAEALFNKGEIGILELNKASIFMMQESFKLKQIESEKQNLILVLKTMNGGTEFTFNADDFIESAVLPEMETMWQEKLELDPELVYISESETIAEQELRLSKNVSFPKLTAGYNQQGFEKAFYSGLYAGISIPIWSNHNKVKSARMQLEFKESYSQSRILENYATFSKNYNEYVLELEKFTQYSSILSTLNNDELLLKTYKAGAISYMEYYMELQFFREAYDEMLDLQYRLYSKKTDLLKYKL